MQPPNLKQNVEKAGVKKKLHKCNLFTTGRGYKLSNIAVSVNKYIVTITAGCTIIWLFLTHSCHIAPYLKSMPLIKGFLATGPLFLLVLPLFRAKKKTFFKKTNTWTPKILLNEKDKYKTELFLKHIQVQCIEWWNSWYYKQNIVTVQFIMVFWHKEYPWFFCFVFFCFFSYARTLNLYAYTPHCVTPF